ncbi:hypothetical protein DCAR_0521586 [Daucus carota subsp. sativus]|uniref:HMA domain-containing protein n=1 Tax=Daucus carota subsp. sativus TaxID=79200 RepID=A0AAF1B339_DAUCS|nr:hypothetical protein DCAR_0521586 [Daucus carota subsp. sativus]
MKSIDLLCASPASTAICSSTDLRAMVRSHGTRSVDRRRHHYMSDHYPRKSRNNVPVIPCSSQLPSIPSSYYQKSRKSASDHSSAARGDRELRRKSSTDIINDLATTTPYGSSRYLLSDRPFDELLPQTDNALALVPSEPVAPRRVGENDSALVSGNQDPRPRARTGSNDSLVVELMVSIHCKGCEGKVRKHISRMEGVSSFSIDRATKKVIVIGEVTPFGVLSSISKVKNAQFWPCPTSLSSS